jgi:hypothetical protein
MSSTILQPLADLVATTLNSLSVDEPLAAYSIDPGFSGLDSLPAAVIGPPLIERTDVDQRESQVGSYDWVIELPVTLLFDLGDTATAQGMALDTVEAFIREIDSATLSVSDPSIVDAKVTRSEPGELVDTARPLMTYTCILRVLKFESY